jgi:hypothetical protein
VAEQKLEKLTNYLNMGISVKSILNDELVSLGFKRKGVYWYKHGEEVISVVGLQKSHWGRYYYINLAIWVKLLGKMEYPPVHQCHIQCRIDDVLLERVNEIATALDEEDEWKIDVEQRRDMLKLAVCSGELYFFSQLKTFEKITNFIRSNPISKHCGIVKSLKDKIGEL